jgi:hypothetical protein
METSVYVPSWAAYYKAHDQTSSYRYMKKVLQCCQYQRGGDRWVLKSPQHLEQFPVLLDVFPDATFVVTHRDPVSVTASLATMVASARKPRHGPRTRISVLVGPDRGDAAGVRGDATCCRPTGQ